MRAAIPALVAVAAVFTAFLVCLPPAIPQPTQPAWPPDTTGPTDEAVPPMFPVPPPFAFSHLGDADFGWYEVTR